MVTLQFKVRIGVLLLWVCILSNMKGPWQKVPLFSAPPTRYRANPLAPKGCSIAEEATTDQRTQGSSVGIPHNLHVYSLELPYPVKHKPVAGYSAQSRVRVAATKSGSPPCPLPPHCFSLIQHKE